MSGNPRENKDDNSFDKDLFASFLNESCVQIKTANTTIVKTINLKR